MPFTLAHPAFALLFNNGGWRSRVSFTGLVLGSMLPDFEYFIRMRLESRWMHGAWGVYLLDLPLGILLAFLFHQVVKRPLYRHIPRIVRSRCRPFADLNWPVYFSKHWLKVIVSLLLGIYSHIMWDSFTHQTGYCVSLLPVLQTDVVLGTYRMPVYKILQHGSTLFGLGCIGIWWMRLPRADVSPAYVRLTYWIWILILSFAILVIRFYGNAGHMVAGNMIVSSIGAFLVSVTVISAGYAGKEGRAH